ncbi:hypothetical protein [Halobellus rubicundus]|uniref:Uncharacterized protein n=1 Tax=Halobellus rubicundus TaxID=2996466 RepID=A0ABD5MGV7_9EURY
MTDREAELERLVERARQHEAVADAFLAKSFTDRLVVVDLEAGESLPRELVTLFTSHDCYGADEVYDWDGEDSSAGEFGDATRYQFVDQRTRGEHRSYVAE